MNVHENVITRQLIHAFGVARLTKYKIYFLFRGSIKDMANSFNNIGHSLSVWGRDRVLSGVGEGKANVILWTAA